MQSKTKRKQSQVDWLFKEMLLADSQVVSKVAKEVVDVIDKYSLSTKITALASILVCWMQRFNLSYTNVLSIADCLTHQNDFNNISDDFKEIYEIIQEGSI